MSTVRANNYYDASGGSNAQLYGVASPPNSMGFRNRIINGDMRIDQRNAGASVSIVDGNNVYPVDRWFGTGTASSGVFSLQRSSSTPPTGFSNFLRATVTTVDSSLAATDFYGISQRIEGFNTADLALGTASASAMTLSFKVRSSLTGTFTGAVTGNPASSASFPFTFTINSANTWEDKTVSVAAPTSGTFPTDNSVGLAVWFMLGVGSTYTGTAGAWTAAARFGASGAVNVMATNGATLDITGVQLEAGTVASPFERRDYGRELYMCQRYCFVETNENSAYRWYAQGYGTSTTGASFGRPLPQKMRAAPSISTTDVTKFIIDSAPGAAGVTSMTFDYISTTYARMFAVASGGGVVSGQATALGSNGDALLRAITYSAEL